jgi:hypothetical protein
VTFEVAGDDCQARSAFRPVVLFGLAEVAGLGLHSHQFEDDIPMMMRCYTQASSLNRRAFRGEQAPSQSGPGKRYKVAIRGLFDLIMGDAQGSGYRTGDAREVVRNQKDAEVILEWTKTTQEAEEIADRAHKDLSVLGARLTADLASERDDPKREAGPTATVTPTARNGFGVPGSIGPARAGRP